MTDTRIHQQFKLQDGRMLGYAEYGAPQGVPIFYFHGFPGSRLEYPLSDACDAALEADVRIIAADRPGYGLSTPKRGRKILDWPADVIALADALQIQRFAVLGISGGGPYAAVCAYRIPERLTKTGIVCGMGPPDAPGMKEGASWTLPGKRALVRRLILMLTSMGVRKDPQQFLAKSMESFSEPDRRLLTEPDVAKVFIEGLTEAFRSGIGGANQDAGLFARSWGFDLHEITSEIHLWHGEQDDNVPVSVGHYVANAIPNCSATFCKEEGHLTLPHNRITEILNTLAD